MHWNSRNLTKSRKEKTEKNPIKMDKTADVKEKKRTVESCIESMEINIGKFSFETEKEEKWSLLSKANSYRETVKGMKRTLITLDKTLNKLEE